MTQYIYDIHHDFLRIRLPLKGALTLRRYISLDLKQKRYQHAQFQVKTKQKYKEYVYLHPASIFHMDALLSRVSFIKRHIFMK